MTKTELTETIKTIKELEAMKKELQAELDSQKALVNNFMAEQNTRKFIGTDFVITISESERRTLDRKALEVVYGSLEKFDKVSFVKRLLIK